jgi:hypothetical protein
LSTVTARTFATKPLSVAEECMFFQSIRLANGTFKTTTFRRLDDVNLMVAKHWKEEGAVPKEILDVGVSSGITSLEWVEQLASAGLEANLTATDLVLQAYLVTLCPGLEALLDSSGYVLQYSFLGVPMNGFQANDARGLGRVVRKIAAQLIRARGVTSLLKNSTRHIFLVHAKARDHPRISFAEDDLFAIPSLAMTRRFDVIRAANVLNLGYFQPAEIKRAILNLKSRLSRAGALLIVVRTLPDGINHGSLFQLQDDGNFRLLERLGSGSEIEAIVLGADPLI